MTETFSPPERSRIMCGKEQGCRKPQEAQGRKPEECSPQQVRKCHGDVREHPCERKAPAQ